MRLILASTSPRRNELLTLLGLPFEVMAPPFVEQVMPQLPADRQVSEFAEGKARSCMSQYPDALILGSDTLISLGSEVLGKPRNLTDADVMLRRLAGQTHTIFTGVALVSHARGFCDVRVATVLVTMRAFDEEALATYLRTGESLGKAGAYSIQEAGGALIDRIEGDYTAAVGLPLRMVADMLRRRGMPCPVDVDRLYALRPYPNWARFGS
ncbi:MAG: septum formation protein Maf [Nitrospira defluvii]|nr:septum formation protein Maf [Nitrospira defluvii]